MKRTRSEAEKATLTKTFRISQNTLFRLSLLSSTYKLPMNDIFTLLLDSFENKYPGAITPTHITAEDKIRLKSAIDNLSIIYDKLTDED